MTPDRAIPRRARFSGWRVLGFATLTGALTGPGQTIGVSVFVDHFITDLALSRSEVSTAYLIGTLVAALGLPMVGRQIDTRGVRAAMTAIGLAFGAALIAMSGVQGFATLIIGFVAIRLLGQGSLMLVSTVAVIHWFQRRRGAALGIFTTGVSILMSLIPVGLSLFIEAYDWRLAWATTGVFIWLTVGPIARFGIKDRPPMAAGVSDRQPRKSAETEILESVAFSRAEALRTGRFWILAAASGSVSMLATALNFHQISLLGDAGLTPTEAAVMFLPQTIGAAIAGLVFGYLSDRLSGRRLIPMALGLLTASLLLASNLTAGMTVVLYALTLGSAGGASRSVGATLLPRWFGTAHIGAIQGTMTFVAVASSALGPVVFSLARDSTGTYEQAAMILALLPITVALAAAVLRPARIPRPD
ncbi:MAG: MFS transporter [Acidimicrobiia bacterium]|nr:MFS transporter [Acidimicrobiia bacterium]